MKNVINGLEKVIVVLVTIAINYAVFVNCKLASEPYVHNVVKRQLYCIAYVAFHVFVLHFLNEEWT